MKKKNNKGLILIILVIVVLLGVGGYFLFGKKAMDKDKNTTTTTTTTAVPDENEKVTIIDSSKGKVYQALIVSTNDSTVYKKEKVEAKDLKDDQKILGTIYFLYASGKYSLDSGIDSKIVKTIATRAYGSVGKLPEKVVAKNSQVSYDFFLSNSRYHANEVYGGRYGAYENDSLFIDKIEQKGATIYMYEKVILNSSFADSGCGTIKKADGSGAVDTYEHYQLDQCPIGKDLYADFPDYYTTYKHTFIVDEDVIRYVSSEPLK